MFDEDLVVPLIGVWDSAKDIDFNNLPERFVLKRTLGGAASEVVLVDMKQDNLEEIKEKAYRWSNINDNAPARIIAEELLQFDSDYIIDYKAYVFNGKVGLYMCGIMKKSGGHSEE